MGKQHTKWGERGCCPVQKGIQGLKLLAQHDGGEKEVQKTYKGCERAQQNLGPNTESQSGRSQERGKQSQNRKKRKVRSGGILE